MTRRQPRLLRLAAPALLLALAVPLAACSGGTSTSESSAGGSTAGGDAGSAAGGSEGDEAAAPEAALADEDAAGGTGEAAGRAEPMQRAVVSTGRLDLRTDDVDRARLQAMRLVRGWGGLVADEETSSDEGEAAYTTMTLRVPSARFATAMTELAELGEVRDQSRAAEDVTTEVVDVAARLRAQERSVRRIEQLLAEAEDLGDVIAIESDLARRQADLDSLKSQQAYLDDQTSLSTISLSLDRESAPPRDDDDAGFLAGLDSGWSAMVGAATVLATAAGAVLPFAVVGVLLGTPLLLAVRRRRGRTPPPAEATA